MTLSSKIIMKNKPKPAIKKIKQKNKKKDPKFDKKLFFEQHRTFASDIV